MRPEVSALRLAERLLREASRDPLRYRRYTIPQDRFLRLRSKRRLLRTGNRVGKTFIALDEVVLRAEKRHPYDEEWNARTGPQHQWIVTVSWSQSIPIQRMLRDSLPAYVRQPTWDPARGWGRDSPTLVWPDGSTVGFRTMRQGPLAHAGAELDHIVIDEPCAIEHYRELERRVISRSGWLTITMTPVNAPGDLQWLRDLVTENVIDEIHVPMTEDAFRFADTGEIRELPDGTPCDAEWIAEQGKAVPRRWREIVLHGEWDEIVTDSEFDGVWDRFRHVSPIIPDIPERYRRYSLGIDHGTQASTETAVLVMVDESQEYPQITVLDCWSADENSPADEDARQIVALLARNGLRWSDLNHVMGDIPHYGGAGKLARKSNKELSYELTKALGIKPYQLSPPIRTAKSGRGVGPKGSVMRGLAWLNRALLRREQFRVHPDAATMIESFDKYRGGSTDPHGHLMDALRYALDPWIRRGQTRHSSQRTSIRVA